ncbi:major intrinsically disordered Notch2-binding receptor 1 [Stegostoma tigrinum]|uniref:major intrinsically disordered Notch2-binding receptor 1 n=1 Tax=Stegostoma tigrinum TaxID=3053191 RepID=UPI00202ACD12|nr:major intrinsically disordered Notch2-binding receptor 1 [Stegostoma tigrinum]
MEAAPEYSLFLVRILEELDTNHSTVSYQDLCKLLCARFDLTHLAKLRSLLFYTACLDPNFPATLFKEKLRCNVDSPQSKKIMIAADIVTMFNLIQMNGGVAKEKLPHRHQHKVRKDESFDGCRSDTEIRQVRSPVSSHDSIDRDVCSEHSAAGDSNMCPTADFKDCQRLICTSDPNFFLGIRNEGIEENKGRAASLDRLQASPTFNSIDPQACVMQTTYFPMDPSQDSNSDQDSPSRKTDRNGTFDSSDEAFTISPCVHGRPVFNGELQDVLPCIAKFVPMDKESEDEDNGSHARKNGSRFSTFFSNSFEMPYNSPYCDSMPFTSQEKRYVKHESLDDLQGSTYFGPSTISQEPRKLSSKPNKSTSWLLKSWSLNNEAAQDCEQYFAGEKPNTHRYQSNVKEELLAEARQRQAAAAEDAISTVDRAQAYFKQAAAGGDEALGSVGKPFNSKLATTGHCNQRKVKDKSVNCSSQVQSFEKTTSVGTQTEQSVRGKGKDGSHGHQPKYGEKVPLKHSDEDSEALSDDISDIFRFLDDMSVNGSTGLLQSCYNSSGSLTRLPKSDSGSLERTPVKTNALQKDQGKGLPSKQPGDEELKMSVCKLVLRIGEIEKKLESLSGVRDEISQVLSKLNKLDQKIQEPAGEKLSPASNHESLRVKALRKNLFVRRSSKSLTEENSATESKITSISNSPRDWRVVGNNSEPGITLEEGKQQVVTDNKDWQRKTREVDRRYVISQSHRPLKPGKDSLLIEQVFSPHVYPNSMKSHMKSNPLYTDLRLTEVLEQKRPQPSWTIEEYNRNVSEKDKSAVLDIQNQESLNPNNLEYWMEDIYTPGYDSLLKRKEAEFRRAKICKMAALIAAAVCTVVLVIVVPICTMKS